MERKSACTCGLLNLEVQREDRPITRASDGKYYLLLTEERRVEIIACRLCGGTDPDEEGWYSKGKPCTCQSLSSWVADPKLSVFYDEMMNEYSMHGLGLFYYCMLCGGRLPKSKRGSFFTEPTQADRDDFMQRTSGLKTIEEVIAVLGPPDHDRRYTGSAVQDMRGATRQITYETIWDSLNGIIQERGVGNLLRTYTGKYIGP